MNENKYKDIKVRALSSVFIVILFVLFNFLGGYYFFSYILFIGALMIYEWVNMVVGYKLEPINEIVDAENQIPINDNEIKNKQDDRKAKRNKVIFKLTKIESIFFGISYIILFVCISSSIRFRKEGLFFILLALFIVWTTDSFAYLGGRFLGKHKLAPDISPSKTVEGLIIGTCASTIIVSAIGCTMFYFSKHLREEILFLKFGMVNFSLLVFLLSIVAHIGDLSESMIKRKFGVKDSGIIIPGHGGALDRFDSLTLVVIVLFFFVI